MINSSSDLHGAPAGRLDVAASEPITGQAIASVQFVSVLFNADPGDGGGSPTVPDFFVDLNLDQIVAAATAGKGEYDLEPFLRVTLSDADAVRYRHEVMRDLEEQTFHQAIDTFARKMHDVRQGLAEAEQRRYPKQKQKWFVDAVGLYVEAIDRLAQELPNIPLHSRALVRVRDYLVDYVSGSSFGTLRSEVAKLNADLAAVHYSMHLGNGSIRVRKFDDRPDYSAEVLAHFERFRQGEVKLEEKKASTSADMNHIEAAILDMVAQLYPEVFADLERFHRKHEGFVDAVIARFDREVQFYVGYLDLRRRFEAVGLSFCYPDVDRHDKAIRSVDGFDLALAAKLVKDGSKIVCNDFYLEGAERIFVVSGPNQGGKTTFARTFGQLHYLACLGLPVPGTEAKLFLFDRLFTHFEREENINNRRGKLQDDLVRIHAILDTATPDSIIVMNEIFTSTALEDALFLSKKILGRIIHLDALAVCVTFIDELTMLGPQTVSVLSRVVPENPAERTYKLARRKADGKAYALAIAEKYRLTYDNLKERFGS